MPVCQCVKGDVSDWQLVSKGTFLIDNLTLFVQKNKNQDLWNFWVYRIICVKFKNKPSYDIIKIVRRFLIMARKVVSAQRDGVWTSSPCSYRMRTKLEDETATLRYFHLSLYFSWISSLIYYLKNKFYIYVQNHIT